MNRLHLRLLSMTLLLSCLASAASAAEAWTWSEPGPHHAAVCLVHASDGSGQSSGSGCYVAVGQIRGVLTAQHCLGGRVSIRWADGHTSSGQATTDSRGADVGFVLATHPTIQPLAISARPPQSGEWLEFCGYGGPRDQLRHWWGRLAAVRSQDARGNAFADYDAPVMQGDSGGSILNRDRQVVGVITCGAGNPFARVGVAQAFRTTGGPAYPVVVDFVNRVDQRYGGSCGPGGCGPGPADNWAYPPRPTPGVPPQPQPVPSPVPVPTPQPSPSVPCPGVVYQVDYERLAACLAPLLAGDDKLRGPPGKDGATGPAGPAGPGLTADQVEALYQRLAAAMAADPKFRGPQGPEGPPGQAASSPDIEAIAAAVAAKLPPMYFKELDFKTGKTRSISAVRLGEGYEFHTKAAGE